MSNYGKVKTFRLDKDDEKLLNECFKMLNVPSDKFSPMMSTFIRAAYRRLEEIKNLREKVDSQSKEIKDQERQIWEREREITLLQPSTPAVPAIVEKPSEVEAITPTQTTQKDEVSKEPTSIRESVKFSSDGLSVLCKGPYYDNWIGKEICAICQDKECEIKKGMISFPKQKLKNLPLKQW
jgi:hypothetical protein